ncbi:unnamed protein product [Caenorhabditis angaria]|uniref:MAM domain-containing protein n=1 Tax=Caenorhabditis angaria TaxID=860376 RepID=A0A9P1NC26_9PELO|nr:unnamed protein product [Caenorhabditis angaria]
MILYIFLLLYSIREQFLIDACLSNQGGCSVASYRYNSDCRQQFDSQSHIGNYGQQYSSGSYNGFLGANVKARAYSEHRINSDYAKKDTDLQCLSVNNCSWQNTVEDDLDWVLGEGRVDSMKLSLITGSQSLPGNFDQTFFILASNPRPSSQDGHLVSMPIGCQKNPGILSFRFWRSRARTLGSEPILDICTRKVLAQELENCMAVIPTDNHTVIASIPPIIEPFVIVLRGYNFINEPEGGLILLDEIEYFSEVEQPEKCVIPIKSTELEPFGESEDDEEEEEYEVTDDEVQKNVISGDTPQNPGKILSHDVVQQAAPTLVNASRELILVENNDSNNDLDENDCRTLQCLMDEPDAQCDYKRSGIGAKGEGYFVGWKITSIVNNKANKLTGIHITPGKDTDSSFLVADFTGFRKYPKEKPADRYVLEAPEFTVSDSPETYLGFKKYLYTKGLFLSVCEDGQGNHCFWNVYANSSEPFARKWTKEIVRLPQELTTFFIIAWQNTSSVQNFGQIGITEIGLYMDSKATQPLC